VSQKRATFASCSIDKHGLILIIFSKPHQNTLKNDAPNQLSFSFSFAYFISFLGSTL